MMITPASARRGITVLIVSSLQTLISALKTIPVKTEPLA